MRFISELLYLHNEYDYHSKYKLQGRQRQPCSGFE